MLKALGLRGGGAGTSVPKDKQEEEAVNSSFAVVDDALSCEYRKLERRKSKRMACQSWLG